MVDSVECFFEVNIYGKGFFLSIIIVDKVVEIVKNSCRCGTFLCKFLSLTYVDM